ncbi:MAG: hypothetical protein RL685_5912 [Pseudomonadota bacterium]|jgi:hypothetical protein
MGEQSNWWRKALGAALLAGAAGLCDAPAAWAGDAPHAAAAQPAVEVLFTGFSRRADNSASIFVRMTGEVPVAVDRAGRRITYRLAGAKLGVPNNGNPLPTEFFGPPVSHVALVPSSDGIALVIDLSSDPNQNGPTHRVASSAGISTLHVDLPPAP